MRLEEVRQVLDYDAETGLFVWARPTSRRVAAGQVAGTLRPSGYVQICVRGVQVYAHRMAWFYVTGEWPGAQLDHVDGDRANNAFANLRECTQGQNSQNRSVKSVKGVTWDKQKGKFKAQITVDGKCINLGLYTNSGEAQAAYVTAKANMHTFNPRLRPA